MQTIKIQQGQTVVDIAMQGNGDASKAFEIALLNGISITDDIQIGDSVNLNDLDASKNNIVNNFLSDGNPASATQNSVVNPETLEGIGYWEIGIDSKVS